MSVLRYINPNVTIDAGTPVPEWGLSAEGRRRAEAMLDRTWASSIGRIVSSAETKALETAGVLASRLGLEVEIRSSTGENDRSATGFVPPAEFECLADALFARPEESVAGWERAVDAQARTVGTLWYCHLTDQPIGRRHDQPGPGHYFSLDLRTGVVLHPWRPVDLIHT